MQVSEFTDKLLVAQEHYKHDPDFWVNSGLVKHQEMEEAIVMLELEIPSKGSTRGDIALHQLKGMHSRAYRWVPNAI